MLWASSEKLRREVAGHLWFLLAFDPWPINWLWGLQAFLRVNLGPLPISDSGLVDQGREQLLDEAPGPTLGSVDSGVLGQIPHERQKAPKGKQARE